MAITAYGSNVNRIVRDGPGKTFFESGKSVASSATNWNQGDLVYLDTSAHVLKRVAATGDAATIQGIADNVVTAGRLAGPYDGLTPVNSAQVTPDFVGPKYGVVAELVLLTSDAFYPGVKVYLHEGGNSQMVTSGADSEYIGIYVGPAVASAAAGQTGFVRLGARIATGNVLAF